MVYLFLADGFEELEALAPVDILRRANIKVKTVSAGEKLTVLSSRKVQVAADIGIGEINPDDLEMIILPGGQPGADNLYDNEKILDIIKSAHREGKYLAAICAAPYILGKLGILNGKKAVCYPGYEKELTGALISDEKVVCDGTVVTARAAGCATDFAFELVSVLSGKKQSDSLRKAMLFD
ncbi:MAG: DJ-1/PfpI family protein [Bacillota bacterium]|nr:DJ-1/PfpI family protein [Bacillota bacterium]